MRKWKHRLTNHDFESRTAHCAECRTTVEIRPVGKARIWRCIHRKGSHGFRFGCCPICSRDVLLVRDHDHKTGVERGWICGQCNSGLGFLGDSRERIQAALKYLSPQG